MSRPFQKGVDSRRNLAGRPEGAIGKRTVRLWEMFNDGGFNFGKEYAKLLMGLPEEKRLEEMKFLLPYIAPQLTAMTFAPMSQADSVENAQRLMDELKAIESANTPAQP